MINNTVLQGRLTRDPELRTTQSGVSVCSFRIAWSEKYKETETKLFIDCTAWRATGEMVAKYFTKGKEIIVEGKLSTRGWQDRDGNKRQSIELTVEHAHFCGPRQDDGYSRAANGGVNVPGPEFEDIGDADGELPF